MKIKSIKDALGATVIGGENLLDTDIKYIYASDLMSDVLAFGKSDSMLLTGLATQQAVISAHMAEFHGVVFIRGKKPKDGSVQFANENNLVLLTTGLDMYESCIRLNELKTKKTPDLGTEILDKKEDKIILKNEFTVTGRDFANAGFASTQIKSILKKIGFEPVLVRRVAISTYEGEMNVVMHADKAVVTLIAAPEFVEVIIDDEGKGIPDVDLAMQQGYSTATEEMRAMGFGSGMGLPNIKKNADELDIKSEVGKGTLLHMKFNI